MEKLIELLNEYDKIKGDKEEPIYNWKIAIKTKIYQTYLISARYGFIKWLVDNNKIDGKKFYEKNILKGFITITKEEKANSIIMNLSISDTPIEDLINYLI